jgi:MFS family permease
VRRLLLLASAVVFVDTAFYSAITPLLPTYVEDLGLSKTAAGVLAAAYPAGTFIGALPGGWLAARAGVRPTVLIGLGIMAASSVAFAFADSVVVLDAARFVQGIGGACSWAGALGWLIGEAPAERRGELIGSAMAAAIVGALFGPVLGAAAAVAGPELVFCGVGAVGVGLMVWALRMPARAPAAAPRLGVLIGALRDRRVQGGMWLMTLPGLMFGTLSVLAPLRLDELGAGATAIAACFLVAAALEATLAPAVGRFSDRRGRRLPAMAGLAAGGAAMALLPWPGEAWLLAGLVVIAAPAIGILWTPAIATLSDGAESHGIEQGIAFAIVNLAWATGQTAGASGSGALAEAAGTDRLPYLLLSAVCLVTLAALARGRSGSPMVGAARPG